MQDDLSVPNSRVLLQFYFYDDIVYDVNRCLKPPINRDRKTHLHGYTMMKFLSKQGHFYRTSPTGRTRGIITTYRIKYTETF